MLPLPADQFDRDLGILGQPVPAVALQLALELGQLTTPGCQHLFSAGLLEEG